MEKGKVMPWLCPQCGCHGSVVQVAPYTERLCRKGHRWADGTIPDPSRYVPLRTRLNEATKGLELALAALRKAEIVVRDCASMLTRYQREKLAINAEVYQIEQAKKAVVFHIEKAGEKISA